MKDFTRIYGDNTLHIGGELRTIPLTQGQTALVDAADFDGLIGHRWRANRNGGTFYASTKSEDGRQVYMHRFITHAPDGFEVDHINGNGLDNRRKNLRLASRQENARNRSVQRNSTTKLKGVYRAGDKFRAVICVDDKLLHLGVFNAPEIAALAYDLAARRLFGEFARPNFNSVTDCLERLGARHAQRQT